MLGFFFKRSGGKDQQNGSTGAVKSKRNSKDGGTPTGPSSWLPSITLSSPKDSSKDSASEKPLRIATKNEENVPSVQKMNSKLPSSQPVKISESKGPMLVRLSSKESSLNDDLSFLSLENATCKEEEIIDTLNTDSSDQILALKNENCTLMKDLDHLKIELNKKVEEDKILHQDFKMLQIDRDSKMAEVQGLSSEMNHLRGENDALNKKTQILDSQVKTLKDENKKLSEELSRKLGAWKSNDSLNRHERENEELGSKIKELESNVRKLSCENNRLLKEKEDNELKIRALDDALKDSLRQKNECQVQYTNQISEMEKSHETLLEDFEWKLRQIESSCKKKLQEKDNKITCKGLENDEDTTHLEEKMAKLHEEKEAIAEEAMKVAHLKSYEAEVIQLRGLTHEQQKLIKSAASQIEKYRYTEAMLTDEILKYKRLLEQEKMHSRNLEHQFVQCNSTSSSESFKKNKLNEYWEQRLENIRTKFKDDLNLTVAQHKAEINSIKELNESDKEEKEANWKAEKDSLLSEINRLKNTIKDKETYYEKEMMRVNTIVDREKCELRRTMDKLSLEQDEAMDRLKESHSEEMGFLARQLDNYATQVKNLEQQLKELNKEDKDQVTSQDLSNVPRNLSSTPTILISTPASDDESIEEEEESDCSASETSWQEAQDESFHQEIVSPVNESIVQEVGEVEVEEDDEDDKSSSDIQEERSESEVTSSNSNGTASIPLPQGSESSSGESDEDDEIKA